MCTFETISGPLAFGKMSDDDDWDVPVAIKKPVVVDEDDEKVEIEESTTSKESSKPKNAIDEKAALVKAQAQSKSKQKEREEELARIAEREKNARPMTAEEKAAEALRLRRLQEDSEAEMMKDVFGAGNIKTSTTGGATATATKATVAAPRPRTEGEQDIESLNSLLLEVDLNTPRQLVDFSKALANRLEKVPKKSSLSLLKDLIKDATVPLTEEEVNELIGILTVIKSDKLKQKLAKKKAAGVAKPVLNTSGLNKAGGDRYDMDDIDDRPKGKGYKNPYEDDDFM